MKKAGRSDQLHAGGTNAMQQLTTSTRNPATAFPDPRTDDTYASIAIDPEASGAGFFPDIPGDHFCHGCAAGYEGEKPPSRCRHCNGRVFEIVAPARLNLPATAGRAAA